MIGLNLFGAEERMLFFTKKDRSLLIWDSATSHITAEVKSIVKTYSKLAVIPGVLTKKL